MKWFKHETDARNSEKLCQLVAKHGLAGKARWWDLLEIVAEKMDASNRCEVAYPAWKWAELLHYSRHDYMMTWLTDAAQMKLICLSSADQMIIISIPNLLQKRDNYTKNLQASNKPSLSTSSSIPKELRAKNKRANGVYSEGFLLFWSEHPRKEGKGKAWEEWQKQNCEPLKDQIISAVRQQKTWHSWMKDNGEYIPHPATWLHQHRWEDEGITKTKDPQAEEERKKRLLDLIRKQEAKLQ